MAFDKPTIPDDPEAEVLESGELADALKEAAVATAEDEEPEITECFIGEDEDTVYSAADILSNWSRQSMKCLGESRIVAQKDADRERELVSKTAVGTTQQSQELGQARFVSDISKIRVVEPPYPPELLAAFLEVDETHWRCVRTKVTDSVGRDYEIVPAVTVKPSEKKEDEADRPVRQREPEKIIVHPENDIFSTEAKPGGKKGFRSFLSKAIDSVLPNGNGKKDKSDRKKVVEQADVDEETQIVEDFIERANDILGFEGVLDRACMDYEAIGWAAIEVIRSVDMKVRRIAHIPAVRARALKGWRGFVEILTTDRADGSTVTEGKYLYYQPFGQKVVSKRTNPISGRSEPYDPEIDGELTVANAEWNLIDRYTGEPTSDLSRAANEIVWIPKHHSNTIYYGFTDVVPALGWLLANIHIRDFLLQYFEHNTVPRYAVIVEGARMSEPVKKLITKYFSTQVKGKAHKTLIVPIPSLRGEVKVRFEKLDADTKEGSFQETKKNNAQSIMTAHGVSPAIIGISEHSELGSGKGLSQAEIYKDRIVTPSQRYWGRKLSKLFKCGLGVRLVKLLFNPLDIRDMKAEQEVLTGYLEKGVQTINEVRKKIGLEPVTGGDRAFILLGNTIMFIDEMTEAMGTEREDLERQIEETKNQMQMKVAMDRVKQQQVPAKGPPSAGSKPAGSTKATTPAAAKTPSNGASNKRAAGVAGK